MPENTFEPDRQVAEVAEAYSLDAVDFAARSLDITLDWSEGSIRQVEEMLGRLHDDMPSARPTQDEVWVFAKAFGSYMGEVLRRHHGGEWGTISMDGQSFPGLRQANGVLIWPWSKAHKRLTNGAEDNVWHYYSILIKGDGEAAAEPGPNPPLLDPTVSGHKKPWWKIW
jgi:hypothetical protein